MSYANTNLVSCSDFEEHLTNYLDKALANDTHKAVAEHALKCPLCHSLLNEVKDALNVCREMAEPRLPMTRLEARILEKTMPQVSMNCGQFEEHLTDYLDGFLPAQIFHRWERHAVLCDECTDLPGAVVRSLAACVTYKLDELPMPDGLHVRILRETIGTAEPMSKKASIGSELGEWLRKLRFPISIPQLAPVAMMLLFAFLVFSQTVSADGSLAGVYATGYELAEQTYQQGADAWKGASGESGSSREPVTGATYVDSEDNK
ncbi:MAG: anti-sigma factor family protein [Pyrinomonadaceae bacterium]